MLLALVVNPNSELAMEISFEINPEDLNQVITCAQGAAEARLAMGVMAHAPKASKLISQLEACHGASDGCLGVPRSFVLMAVQGAAKEDYVLALLN